VVHVARAVMKNIYYVILIGLSFCFIENKALAADNDFKHIEFPIIKKDRTIYVTASLAFIDLKKDKSKFQSILDFNNAFIKTSKSGDFENAKKLYDKHDGSQVKFNSLKKVFNASNIYKNVSDVSYKFGLVWGDYYFISVDYTVNGKIINIREDQYCPQKYKCSKTLRDFGQLFEISYLNLINIISEKPNIQLSGVVSKNMGEKKNVNVLLPDSVAKLEENNFKLSVGIKKIKSNICIKCPTKLNGILKDEKFLLSEFVSFVKGINDLDFSDYNQLKEYAGKYNNANTESTAYPLSRWKNGKIKTVYADVSAYLSRMEKWEGGIPLGYIHGEQGIYIFISFNKKISNNQLLNKKFDMDVIYLKQDTNRAYKYRPQGNEAAVEQTFIRDGFFMGTLKNIFINDL